MNIDYLITALLSLIVGAVAAWFICKMLMQHNLKSVEQMLLQESTQKEELEKSNVLLRMERDEYLASTNQAQGKLQLLEAEQQKYFDLQTAYAAAQKQSAILQTELTAANKALQDKQTEMQEIGANMRIEFQNLANDILDNNSKKFAEANDKRITEILQPLKNEMTEFKKKVEDTYDKESKERFSLSAEVKRLVETTQMIGQEANNLTTALKGNKKQQGNWGEMLLESILEHSGLTKGREYFTQEFIKDATGNIIKDEFGHGLQPDVTIYYPDQRKIIIDSKVSLNAWINYTAANTPEEQAAAWQAHVQSVRNHVTGLSRKNYPKYALALDYVIMFVPNEAAFLEVMKVEQTLWKEAYDKKILMVSPTNLLAVLKIIADLWIIERQNAHAIEIAEKAGELYDKFVGFVGNLNHVGEKMTQARTAYDEAFKQLHTGRGNLVKRAEDLRKMGVKAQKKLDQSLLNEMLEVE